MDVLVIGGGIGGLTAGALLAKTGHAVTVLESSLEWGGCAGKFQRRGLVYPVGATLGMGLEPGGLHERVLRLLGRSVEANQLEEVMMLHFPDRTITYYRDRDAHLASLCRHFPDAASRIRSFYKEVWQTAALTRELMKPLPALPPQTASEWAHLTSSLRLPHASLAPLIRATLLARLQAHGLEQEHGFIHFLNGQLIDSMQTTAEHVSFLMAATALDVYHEGAYYVTGGLYRIAEELAASIQENGGTLRKKRHVVSLAQTPAGWTAHDQRGNVYSAKHVVFNGTVHQLPSLVSGISKKHQKMANKPTWVTHTLYVTLDERYIPESFPLFQQISSPAGTMSEGHHLFMSISAPDDRQRAPIGKRTMTVSTHSKPDRWQTKTAYDESQRNITEQMLSLIETVYPSFRRWILSMETGSPKAWERYTQRPNGYVGGFAQTVSHSLFGSLSHRSGLRNLWLCGDSIFPGGGTIGATASGIHCARSIAPGLFTI